MHTPDVTISGRYVLREKLGEGGMGAVYLGTDLKSNESVAIKALKSNIADANMIQRFTREGESLRKLNHPNIVKMLDSIEEDGQYYLIMELVTGGSLQTVIENESQIAIKQVLEIALDLADALTRAHRLNIIHRDIKPANVLLDDAGTPRLTDFGIARTGNSTITETGAVMGTTAYIAPEMIKGEPADERADIWSFGVLLFEMLTGGQPFSGDNPGALIFAILSEPVPDLSQLRPQTPPALIDLIYRMLAKSPDERIPSVRLVGAELEAILQNRPYDTSGSVVVTTSDDAAVIKPSRFVTPTPALEQPKHNLPAQMTPFIGREQQVTSIRELLLREGVRLVTLTGTGGIGKTRLSLHIAHGLIDAFADGAFFVSLAAVSDPADVAVTIANSLDIRQGGDRPPLDSIKDYLQYKHMLLLLDNFEQVTSAAPVITELLEAASGLSILVTSRRPLNLRGEHEYGLMALTLPDMENRPSLEILGQIEAIKLFVDRGQAARPNFDLTEENAPVIAEICQQLDGIPLAIELAAARIKLLPLQNLLSRLSSRLQLLTGGARDLPARQQTLRSAIDWSFSLLEEAEQRLFARLSVFVNGFSLESAEVVCNVDGSLDILTGVESLMNNSLLWQKQAADGEVRFGMLATIREYAQEKLREAGEEEKTREKHARYFADQMTESMMKGYSGQVMDWLRWCDDEHDNMLSALAWSQATDDEADVGLRLITAMTWFWYRRGYIREGADWCTRVLAKTEKQGATLLRGLALGSAGAIATWIGDLDTALKRANESVAILQVIEEGPQLAFSIMGNGVVHLNRGDETTAGSYFETSLTMFKEFGVDFFAAVTQMHLGNVELARGEIDAARTRHEEAYALAKAVGDKWLIASVVNNLGEVARVQSDYEHARAYYEESETLYREMGDKGDLARLVHSRGYIALYQGDFDRARAKFLESLNMFQILGNQRGIAECLAGFAGLANKNQDPERVIRLLGAAQAIMDKAHAGWWPADRTEIAHFLSAAQDSLDDKSFEKAKAEGEAMTLEQAVAYCNWLN